MAAISTELMLVRHGQTDWNACGRWQGHADRPLTDVGREQARSVAEALRAERADEEPWDRFVSSDLRRARETAEILGLSWSIPHEIDTRLRELDVGRWSGKTREEILATDAGLLEAFESGDPTIRPPEGETRIEIRARTRAFVEDVASRWRGQRILVVTHLGVIRALLPQVEPENLGRHTLDVESWLDDRVETAANASPRIGPL